MRLRGSRIAANPRPVWSGARTDMRGYAVSAAENTDVAPRSRGSHCTSTRAPTGPTAAAGSITVLMPGRGCTESVGHPHEPNTGRAVRCSHSSKHIFSAQKQGSQNAEVSTRHMAGSVPTVDISRQVSPEADSPPGLGHGAGAVTGGQNRCPWSAR